MADVITPVLGGAAGFIGARYVGNMLAMRDMLTTDPKVGKTIAAAVGIPATFWIARSGMAGGIVRKNSGALVLGMGLAAAESWIRDTPLLGGSPAAAAVTDDAAAAAAAAAAATTENGGDGTSGFGAYVSDSMSGLADYYSEGMLGGLGADPANQANVEGALDQMESVSTIIPSGLALRASTMAQIDPVRESFTNSGDTGHAGGMFARHLFSGMMGS